jgi:hypothetical protein
VSSKKTRAKPMSKKIVIWLLATVFLATVSLVEAQQATVRTVGPGSAF